MEHLYTTEELADKLGLEPQTLRKWRCQKKGPPYIKVETTIRYDWHAVQLWLEARVTHPETPDF